MPFETAIAGSRRVALCVVLSVGCGGDTPSEPAPTREILRARQAIHLASESQHNVEIPLDLALLMSVAAYRLSSPTVFDAPASSSQSELRSTMRRAAIENAREALFEAASRQFKAILMPPVRVSALAWQPKAVGLVAGDGDGNLSKWDLATRRRVTYSYVPAAWADISAIAVAPDGRTAASAHRGGRVVLWDLSSDRLPPRELSRARSTPASSSISEEFVSGLAFARQGRIVLASHAPHREAFSGPAQRAAAETGRLTLWAVANPRTPLATFRLPHRATALAVDPDGTTMAIAGADAVITRRTVDGFQRVGTPIRLSGVVRQMAFVEKGEALVTLNADGALEHWDLAKGGTAFVLEADDQSAPPLVMAVDAAAHQVALVNERGHFRIWDVAGRQVVHRSAGTTVYRPTTSAAWSPDGRTFAIGGSDEYLNRARGPVGGTRGHGLVIIYAMAGQREPRDQTAVREKPDASWDAPRAADAVCAAVGRSLTPREWDEYVNTRAVYPYLQIRADLPYEDVCAAERFHTGKGGENPPS